MREFQERRRIKKLLHSRYAIALLAITLLLLSRAVWGIYIKYEKSKEIADKVKSDLKTLEDRQASLIRSIESLRTDEGKERELRDRFGLVKDGERLVVLVDDKTEAKTGTNEINDSWWRNFLDAIGL
jgi:cell division protein FtsB